MQVNIKASYRDTATVKVHTLDDFIRKVTFSPKGIQPDELQRRKNNGAVRLGHGIERFFYPTIAAKIGCEYIVRQLIPDWQPGVAIGNGFVFPDDDSDSDEQPAVESKTSSYDSELTEEEKKTLGDLARQQDKLELVWAIKGFDFGYLNHLKINQTRHYTDKKTGKQVPVKMPWEVMKEQGAKFIGFFWNPMMSLWLLDSQAMAEGTFNDAVEYWRSKGGVFHQGTSRTNTPIEVGERRHGTTAPNDGTERRHELHTERRHGTTAQNKSMNYGTELRHGTAARNGGMNSTRNGGTERRHRATIYYGTERRHRTAARNGDTEQRHRTTAQNDGTEKQHELRHGRAARNDGTERWHELHTERRHGTTARNNSMNYGTELRHENGGTEPRHEFHTKRRHRTTAPSDGIYYGTERRHRTAARNGGTEQRHRTTARNDGTEKQHELRHGTAARNSCMNSTRLGGTERRNRTTA